MKKRCAVFHGAGREFEIREFEVAKPAGDAVGLKLVSSGICGTDVHIHQGFLKMPDFPLIIGHEFIGEIDASGSSREENKIRLELKKILDCDIPVNAHTVRVPVRNCHGIAIFARFEKDPDIGEAVRILSEAPGVKLFTEGFPMPVNMQGEKSVGVGRIRKGESPNSLSNSPLISSGKPIEESTPEKRSTFS